MNEFEIFHLIYLISIAAISIIFIVYTILTHKKLPLKEVTFDDYFRAWTEHHGYNVPIEEIKGPLRPYLKSFFVAGKLYAQIGLTPNSISVLGVVWALWTLECWFLGGNWILLGVLFVILSGTTDSIDGVVAFITGSESNLGAWYDAVLDKFGDILWVIGPIYFIFVIGIYTTFWLVLLAVVGLLGLLNTLIQEYARARHEGLGLLEGGPVIGERISRLGFFITLTACIGFSNVFTSITPSTDFININIWMTTYIIPICFFGLLAFSIISILQLTRHVQKNLK